MANNFNTKLKSDTGNTVDVAQKSKVSKLAVGDVVLRCMSARDVFQLDVEDEDVADQVSASNGVLYNMLWGKDKKQFRVQQSMMYSTSFALFPPLLCFHLKRISIDAYGKLSKVKTMVHFPVVLDVNQYVKVPESNGRIMRSNGCDVSEPSGSSSCSSTDSDTSSVSSRSDEGASSHTKSSPIANYLLRAVVVHSGTPMRGKSFTSLHHMVELYAVYRSLSCLLPSRRIPAKEVGLLQ